MSARPYVSIIVRAFNEEEHLGRLLEGIYFQKVDFPIEVILVDSGSTDRTLEIAAAFPVRIVHIAPEEFSFGRSLNLGVASAQGDLCVIVSAHCYPVDQDWLTNLVAPFTDERTALVYGRQRGDERTRYSEEQIFASWFPDESVDDYQVSFCNNANSAIRRSVWKNHPYDEELPGLEDIDWARRVRRENHRISYQATAGVHHVHDENRQQIYRRYYREALAYRQIYPDEAFRLFDFARFFVMNTLSDAAHAVRDGCFLANAAGIPVFRGLQFWATYRAHARSGITKEMQRQLYYPRLQLRSRPLAEPVAAEAEEIRSAEVARPQATGNPVTHRILITAPYMVREREIVEPLLDRPGIKVEWYPVRERLEANELLGVIEGVDGIICGDDRITREVLDRTDSLKVIVKWGTGIDSIDRGYANERGIPVRNTPEAFTLPVADTALGYMLAFCRGIAANDRILKDGGWDKPQGYSLSEKTVGIIGFGSIGTAVAKRLRPFEARILANDIREIPSEQARTLGVRMSPLETLLAESDFVTLHCDLNETSHHILNAESLARCGPGTVVINTARGPLVDEPALVAALESGEIAGAGLDVFEHEPLPLDSPLRRMPQVLLAAHNSNSSPQCWQRVHRNSAAMLFEELGLG
jgi:D-3-phosphoglycerate dehydrogenase